MNNYIVKTFAIYSENGKEAAKKVRWLPRVKHHVKDAIVSVEKISAHEYETIIEINRCDNYFKCETIQEQNMMCDLNSEIYRNEGKMIYKINKRIKKNKLESIFIKESRRTMNEYRY